jgi:hypothetical protein
MRLGCPPMAERSSADLFINGNGGQSLIPDILSSYCTVRATGAHVLVTVPQHCYSQVTLTLFSQLPLCCAHVSYSSHLPQTAEAVGFFLCKKSSARLPSEGKLNNLSHVPTLRHVKEPFTHSVLRADSEIPLTVPSFASRGLSRRLVR